MYLLDTNICIYIINKKPAKVLEKFNTISPTDIGISSITVAELNYGVEKSQFRGKNREALQMFLQPFDIFDFDYIATSFYGKIRHQLEKKGKPIGAMDLLIASHAMGLEKILVTNNAKEFSKIPNLKIENWV